MATTTYYIRSHYNRDRDLERLQRETGQLVEDDEQPELPEEDPWEKIQSFGVRQRLANAPRFVPATIAYDPWNEGLASLPEEPKASSSGSGGIADWYKSLTQSNLTGDTTSTVETIDASSQTATTPAPAPSHPIASSSSISAPTSRPSSTHPRRTNPDWFISRALSSQTSTSSAPPTPTPTTSLADILLRDPPITSQPLKPPVFLHLGPSNKGWAMLQSRGWREGEGLGVGVVRMADTRADGLEEEEEDELDGRERKRIKRENSDSKQTKRKEKGREVERVTVKEGEHVYESDDDIIEVKKTEIIDLTLSDSESESDSDSENNTSEVDDDPATVPSPSAATTTTTTTAPQLSFPPPTSHHATQTSLLTPLPTVLKSDRLGIGLKAKTEGPYHSSVKRVTHNAAAMREHVRRGEETRRRKVMEGKGRRAFERRERKERERWREMLAYMNG